MIDDEVTQPPAILDLVERIASVLAGNSAEAQGGALADLVAIYLAGHVVVGDEEATRALRENLLALHIATVRVLIDPNAKMMGKVADA